MKVLLFLASSFAGALAQANVAALGSSYAYGANLVSPYGKVVADKLAKAKGATSNFRNFAVPGSVLANITYYQAAKLSGAKWDAVVVTTAGNDLDYVKCLSVPNDPSCPSKLPEATLVKSWGAALDAIFKNLPAAPNQPPVYIVTYPRFLGGYHQCKPSNPDCPLDPQAVSDSITTYNKIIDWTVEGVQTWKKASPSNAAANLKVIPMRSFSAGHEIGSGASFINGAVAPAAGNGTGYHPTQLAANFMGTAVFNNLLQRDDNPSIN